MKTEHKQIWDNLHPNKTEIKDYTNRLIKKEAYNQINSEYGWVIELINPNREATIDNVHVVSIYANAARNGKASFVIDGNNYQLQKVEGTSIFKIVKIKQEQTKDVWQRIFGNKQSAKDFCGREIRKDKREDSKYGWNVDHIMPQSKGGTNTQSNLQIVHKTTNAEKGDKITFLANGKTYQVRKNKESLNIENNFYDYSACDYCIIEVPQPSEKIEKTENKTLSRTEFWRNEFGKKNTAVDYDEVSITINGDWVIELLNPEGKWVINNAHIVAKKTNEERAERSNFSIYDEANGCECYYRLRRNTGELSKKQMSEAYDYTNKEYYIERNDVIFDEDEDDDGYYD